MFGTAVPSTMWEASSVASLPDNMQGSNIYYFPTDSMTFKSGDCLGRLRRVTRRWFENIGVDVVGHSTFHVVHGDPFLWPISVTTSEMILLYAS